MPRSYCCTTMHRSKVSTLFCQLTGLFTLAFRGPFCLQCQPVWILGTCRCLWKRLTFECCKNERYRIGLPSAFVIRKMILVSGTSWVAYLQPVSAIWPFQVPLKSSSESYRVTWTAVLTKLCLQSSWEGDKTAWRDFRSLKARITKHD